jgi:hypothetical protein
LSIAEHETVGHKNSKIHGAARENQGGLAELAG